MGNAKCVSCKKSFEYTSKSGKITCPHCWVRFNVIPTPDPKPEKVPSKNERLLALREEIDLILQEGEEDGADI